MRARSRPPGSDARTSTRPGQGRVRLGQAAGRLALSVGSQGVSSLSNLLFSFAAAAVLSPTGFGTFTAAYVVGVLGTGLVRALLFEPALALPGLRGEVDRSILGAAAAAGGLGVMAGLVAASVVDGALSDSLLALAVVFPGLVLLDGSRHVAFRRVRPAVALRLDLVWAAGQGIGLALLLLNDVDEPSAFILVWGLAALPAAIVGVASLGGLAAPGAWLSEAWGWSWRYASEWLLANAAANVALLALGAVAGVEALGAIRLVQLAFGPLNVLFVGALATVIPAGAQIGRDGLRRVMVVVASILGGAGVLVTSFLLLDPAGILSRALGEAWVAAEELVLPVGLTAILSGIAAGPLAALRALREAAASLCVRMIVAPSLVAIPLLLSVEHGAIGFAWGDVIVASCAAALWWRSALRAAGEPGEGGHGDTTGDSPWLEADTSGPDRHDELGIER